MTSQVDVRQGAQVPTVEHLPSGTVDRTSGEDAIALAASVGLDLDPWQQRVLLEALGERADGLWSAFEVLVLVPRQNGKGSILEALELAALFVFKERLIVHSAHEFRTAREHFRRICGLVARSEDLSAKIAGRIHTANGNESIETDDGCRLMFVARSRGAARGFTADRLVLDEAFNLSIDAMGAMLPALSTVPNPQVWYTSSAPHSDSLVLHKVRERSLVGDDPRLYAAAWENQPGTDPDDDEALSRANPGRGLRISDEFLHAERATLREMGDEYARERLGIPAAMDAGATVFGAGKWAACADPESQAEGTVSIALDVGQDMQFSSFAAAGRRADGFAHIEVIERRPGTDWVVARAKQLTEKWDVPLALDPKSPTGGLLTDLRDAGVEVTELSGTDVTQACSTLQKAILNGTARHLDQPPLNAAVAGAAISSAGDTWKWARKTAAADISPLVAVTVAFWASSLATVDPAANVW